MYYLEAKQAKVMIVEVIQVQFKDWESEFAAQHNEGKELKGMETVRRLDWDLQKGSTMPPLYDSPDIR